MERINNLNNLLDRRRELRNNPTEAEDFLWQYLRNKKLGVKFRRQHSIGGYIIDFYCIENMLVIEVDGEIHNKSENKEYDQVRDKFFSDMGFRVLRFTNEEVENNIKLVLEKIRKCI